jgi:hypothetical protein
MANATGTLAWLNEFLSDTPTDIAVVNLRAAQIISAISAIATELDDELKQTPRLPLDQKREDETIARVDALNRELERLLMIKRQLENQKR